MAAVVCLLGFSYKRCFEPLAGSDLSWTSPLLIITWMLLLPASKTFLPSPKPSGRRHTKARSMMGLSKLISANGKRLAGCSSFGARLLLLAVWHHWFGSGLLCFAEPSLCFLNPTLLTCSSASVSSGHPSTLLGKSSCSPGAGVWVLPFQIGWNGRARLWKASQAHSTTSPAFCYWEADS